YGTAVHLLLEHLPDVPAASRAAMAPELLADGVPALAPEARAQAIAEVEAVLTAPFAAALFGPGSHAEAGVGGALPHDGTSLLAGAAAPLFLGRIDRLVVTPDRVLAVDYKSDARPATPDAIPPGYLAQLGAYGVALARLYPGREIALALLWTALPRLDDVDPAAARSAFEAALSRLRDGAA
ncbi:MAG: PD-(D/E)XK nuclease family protein, partial [Pseudomonadota bacterium]